MDAKADQIRTRIRSLRARLISRLYVEVGAGYDEIGSGDGCPSALVTVLKALAPVRAVAVDVDDFVGDVVRGAVVVNGTLTLGH